jgi:AcrR family transcriptional regulator
MARTAPKSSADGRRRSGLLQERSQQTRHELVRAALELWTERGFEHGIEDTTAEEIAQAAGVTKGTFYFHFAYKEEILLEMGIETAEAMMKEADLGMRRGRPAIEILHALMASLSRRVEKAPRGAVLRSLSELSRRAHDMPVYPVGATAFSTAFASLAAYAVDRGELPPDVDAEDFGAVLQAVIMDTVIRWAKRESGSLRSALVMHTDLIVAGAAAVYPTRSARKGGVAQTSKP